MKKYSYFIPSYGINREDVIEFHSDYHDPEFIAEEAAEDWHQNHDGWECTWPITFHIIIDSEAHVFEVAREYDPIFIARKI